MDSDFRLFSFGRPARLVLAGGMYALGAAIQLAFPIVAPLGIAVAVLGWAPLLLKSATNKPDDQGLEEWRLVSLAEIDRLEDSLRETKKLKRKMAAPRGLLLFVFALPFFLVLLLVGKSMGRADLVFVAVNAAVYLLPSYLFGRVSVFQPKEISMKMPSFRAVLEIPRPEGVTVAPYLRFDKDSKGQDVPEDLRLLFELKRPPSDLVGIQVQAAINKGPNGEVPYLYAVVLTRGTSGPAHLAAEGIRAQGYEVEAGGDGEYGTVVIRQETSNGGYCTTPDDCRGLASTCIEFLRGVRPGAP